MSKIDTEHWICEKCNKDFKRDKIFSTICPVCGGPLKHDIRRVEE